MDVAMNPSNVKPSDEASKVNFLRRQMCVTLPTVLSGDVDLADKTAIVTGGNAGLGFQCCVQLVDLGLGRLVIAARNEAKGQAAKEELCARKHTKTTIEVWWLDLGSYDSVQAFVERVKTLDGVDMIVQSAAMFGVDFKVNDKTKHEEMVQVNYLSNALLTILLLPVLRAKKRAGKPATRIAWVNSETAAWAQFKERSGESILAELDKPGGFEYLERYCTSKLLCQLFVVELCRRVSASTAVVVLVNPGFCWGSRLHRDVGGVVGGVLAVVKRIIGRSPEEGARTLTDAVVRHGDEVHGQYLGDCKLKPMAPLVYQAEGAKIAEALWAETMAELEFAHVEEVLAGVGE
ncbi:hypothetical protein CDD82_1186 [Ophiocordyceps australis]|uniref:Ketoreductase (KR) domain-containing protein n=1 Tax=Ophiocordyceps australis TaxID=1399860 RepID=A0A2C5ZJN2_9HYPO|nr:hypothetical protein CDD82_1186 [Ophiocordyceps australis]